MSDKNSPFINLPDLPDSVDNAVKNLTDKPTQGIGQTFADAWFLVFGRITQAATKLRIKYAHDLELYKQELSQAITSIPKKNLIAPDIQTTAQALENSKYCIESVELRKLFVNLISKSMNSNYAESIHPSFAEIIKQMDPIDALVLQTLNPNSSFPIVDYTIRYSRLTYNTLLPNVCIPPLESISIKRSSISISSLNRLGIITLNPQARITDANVYIPFEKNEYYQELFSNSSFSDELEKLYIKKYLGNFTPLGRNFFEVCVK